MTDTDSDGQSDPELAVDKNPSNTDVPYGDETASREYADKLPDPNADGGVAASGTSVAERETAPQSPYTMRQVCAGAAVTAVGLLVAFGLPLLLV